MISRKKEKSAAERNAYKPDMLEFDQIRTNLDQQSTGVRQESTAEHDITISQQPSMEQQITSEQRQGMEQQGGIDQQLHAMEAASIDILNLLREQRDNENARIQIAERTFVEADPVETPPSAIPQRLRPHRSISPWWLAAAVAIGFVFGFAMPRASRSHADSSSYSLLADSLQGCSLAAGDVNHSLLVSF